MLRVCLSVGCVVENKIILQSGEISATSIIIHIIIHIIRGKPSSQIDASTRGIYASHRVAICHAYNMTQEPAMRRDE